MNNPHAFHFTIALAGILLLAGCSTRRPYRAPALPQIAKAESWNNGLAGGASTQPADQETLSRWWATLGDSVLTSLEERAVKGNLDLRKAEAKIRQARAQWEAARADRNVGGSLSTSATGNRSNTRSGGEYAQTYYGTLDASWEPDFFHRIEKTASAYGIDVETAREDLRATLVSLTAEVALDYIDVRSYQQQLAITKDNLARQEQTYTLTVAEYESGLATRLDVEETATNMESTRAGIPSLETAIQKSSNAIAVLLGDKPGAIDAELAVVRPVPTIPAEVAVGIPADLVRRRPDIRSAERQIAAQSARVGAAAANLYPSFSLSATFSLTSFNVLNYLTPASLASSLLASVQQTVFNRRKLRESVKVQYAALDQYVIAYEDAVLSALRDVEDALKAFAGEQVRRKSLADAAASAERAAEMSRNLYGSGLKDFLSVLDAERSVLTLQNEVAQSDAAITANLVRLYKALGGGWS